MRAKNSLLVWLTLGYFLLVIVTGSVHAQNTSLQEGWNGATQSLTTQSPSFSFVDGAGYVSDSRCNGGCDICQIIQYALADYNASNSNGDIIDTRGITSLACKSADPNPWQSLLSAYLSNIVLLPAGTITIPVTWVLPRNTHLIGEGPNATVIAANFSTGDIIDMGAKNASGCTGVGGATNCPGTVIEHLQLNGNGNTAVNGIVNSYGQELNRVNDVTIVGVNVGLTVNDYANDSGPYSDILMTNVAQCVNIGPGIDLTPTATRGVHGLTCVTTGTSPAAIQISTSNNSLQDVYISGGSQQDGVLIASSGSSVPWSNVLLNISGSGLKNVIHIESTSDLSILGASRSGGTNLIQDDVTNTTLTDTNVGMYVLGEAVAAGSNSNAGNSRFTTSTNAHAPTWLVGATNPGGTTCGVGDLYSCTGSGCSHTLWECNRSGSGTTWAGII